MLANLTGAMLIRSTAALTALVVRDGTLVVSGFMDYERPGVEAALDDFDVVAREPGRRVVRGRAPPSLSPATSPRAAAPSSRRSFQPSTSRRSSLIGSALSSTCSRMTTSLFSHTPWPFPTMRIAADCMPRLSPPAA